MGKREKLNKENIQRKKREKKDICKKADELENKAERGKVRRTAKSVLCSVLMQLLFLRQRGRS